MLRFLSVLTILLFAKVAMAQTIGVPIPNPATDCDLTINDNGDWSSINSATVACVDRGNYTGVGTITLTKNCTQGTPCWIIFDGTDAGSHAYHRSSGNKAKVQQINCQGDWWRIIGLTFTRSGTGRLLQIDESCDDLIVHENEFVGGGSGSGAILFKGGDDTIMQLNVMHTTIETAGQDNHCIKFDSDGGDQVVGTKILSNEIFNCAGDGIQIGDSTDTTGGFETILIEDNDIYFTTSIYSNCSGSKTPTGNCMCAEDPFDVKQGSATTNIITIRGNRMWGARATDASCGGTGGGVGGMSFDFSPRYYLFEANIMLDNKHNLHSLNVPKHG